MSIVSVRDAHRTYGSGPGAVHALRGVTLDITAGEFTVIAGPSGSGKSTLLNLIGCLDLPSTGTVSLDGQDVGQLSGPALAKLRAQRIGFIFQSFNLIPVLTALENVELALTLAGERVDTRSRAAAALDAVGLAALTGRRPSELSGGQQQRVAIARALVKNPALVIADEPTANLDSETGAQVLDIMQSMNTKYDITFLFSTHDAHVMARARRIVRLHDGLIASDGAPDAGPGQ